MTLHDIFHLEPTIRVGYSIENDHFAESRISALVNITCQTGVTDGRPKYQILYDHRPAFYSNPDQDRTYYDEKNIIIQVHGQTLSN